MWLFLCTFPTGVGFLCVPFSIWSWRQIQSLECLASFSLRQWTMSKKTVMFVTPYLYSFVYQWLLNAVVWTSLNKLPEKESVAVRNKDCNSHQIHVIVSGMHGTSSWCLVYIFIVLFFSKVRTLSAHLYMEFLFLFSLFIHLCFLPGVW